MQTEWLERRVGDNATETAGRARLTGLWNTYRLPAILLLAVALRVAAAIALGDRVVELPGTADQRSYHELAQRVLAGHGFSFAEPWWPFTAAGAPTAHWSYLYTLYLAGVYAVFGVHPLAARLLQALLVGLLQPYLAYRIAGRLSGGQAGVAVLAAALSAVYGYFIYYSATLMTEPFFITSVLAVLWCCLQLAEGWRKSPAWAQEHGRDLPWALALGFAAACAVLLRQLFLLMLPVAGLWLVLVAGRQARRRLAPVAGVVLLVLGLSILPFTLHNYQRFGHFVLLNTNAGYAFYWANHPVYGTRFESILPASMGDYQALLPPDLPRADEAVIDQELLKRGLQFVVADPVRYLALSASRLESYFKFWPEAGSSPISNLTRVGSFGLSLPFMVAGLYVAIRRRTGPAIWLLCLFAAAYTAIHLLSWTLIRYRLPVDAVLLISAAWALHEAGRWLVAQRAQPVPGKD